MKLEKPLQEYSGENKISESIQHILQYIIGVVYRNYNSKVIHIIYIVYENH